MRKKLAVLGVVLAVAVTLGLSVATVGKAIADSCSGCGCCNAVSWSAATSPTTVTAESDGDFSFSQTFNWTFDELWSWTGTIVQVVVAGDNIIHTGADQPDYTPNLFFSDDECCTGSLTIQTTGQLDDETSNGTLRTSGRIVTPLFSSTKDVTINHS